MKETEYQYYKDRLEEKKLDLFQTVTTRARIRHANVIDVIVFLSGLILIWVMIDNIITMFGLSLVLSLLIYSIVYFSIRTLMKGYSIGYLLMNIRYANIKTTNLITSKGFFRYLLNNIKLDVRILKIYSYHFTYDNWLLQSEALQDSGLLLVDRIKYNSFSKEHKKILEKVKEYEAQLETT